MFQRPALITINNFTLTLEGGLGEGGGGFNSTFRNIAIAQYNAVRIWSQSICKFTNVHPGQFLGLLGARFNFGGPGNAQDRQIWNFWKF